MEPLLLTTVLLAVALVLLVVLVALYWPLHRRLSAIEPKVEQLTAEVNVGQLELLRSSVRNALRGLARQEKRDEPEELPNPQPELDRVSQAILARRRSLGTQNR